MPDKRFMYPSGSIRKRNHLPHLDVPNGIYGVTYCLADALGPRFFRELETRRASLLNDLRQRFGRVTPQDERSVERKLRTLLQSQLDRGEGSCFLARPGIADIIETSLSHFDGVRYRLISDAVMPNHVHVVFHAWHPDPWWKTVGAWKSFTSKEANKALGHSGQFWQDDNYDELIRGETHLSDSIRYVLDNPVKARLLNWPWARQLVFPPFAETLKR